MRFINWFITRSWFILLALTMMWPQSGYAESGSARTRVKIRKKTQLLRPSTAPSEEFDAERFEVLNAKRRNLILDIRRFITSARDEAQKAELNLRLAALFREDYTAGLAKSQVKYDKDLKACEAKKCKVQPKLDNSEALGSLAKARAIYRDLVQRYTRHPRRDEMLFFLAQSSLDMGKTEEGMAFFKRLANETPNSRYVFDSLVQLGDHHFDHNQFAQAEPYYDKIIGKKYRPLLSYSVYKKAWCAYNQQRPSQALQHFKWVIQNEDTEDTTTGNPIRIKNEALKDVALPFVDLKMVQEAVAFFEAQGEPHHRRGIESMAGLYREGGNYKNGNYLYEQLLALDPNHAKNPTYDLQIVESYRLMGDTAKAVERLFARFPGYLENSNWYELNSTTPATITEAKTGFEELARKFAFQLHADGQKTKNENLYASARKLYAKYLEYFPNTAHSAKVRFFLAEILYKQNDYLAASDQYYAVYKAPSAGDLKLDSIRYSLNALDREINTARRKAGLKEISSKSTAKLKEADDVVLEAVPFSEAETKFIEISKEYLAKYADQKDAPQVLYMQAYLQYTHHELINAYKSFWQIVTRYPKHDTAYGSAYLILDVLNRRKEFPKLIAACKKFLEPSSQMTLAKFRTDVADVLRKSELKQIQLLEEKGQYKEAADGYIEYSKAYGRQDEQLFEKALYNAAIDHGKANLLMQAVETQEHFLRRFPKSTFRENMLLQVAKTHENLANFEKAAKYFEMFATNYTSNVQAKNALRLAGLYYWGAGQGNKAEQVMRHAFRSYPDLAKQLEGDLLSVYQSSGSPEKTVKFLLELRSRKGLSLTQYVIYSVRIAEILAEHGSKARYQTLEEAVKVAGRAQTQLTATPEGAEALSKLHFWIAKQREDYFYSLKLALPQARLEANLKKKLELLKQLENEYQHITKLGTPEWGLASIYKSAALYRDMAEAVLEAPVPNELNAEQMDFYRSEIKKTMIDPFNEKALGLVVQCLDKAQEFNVLSSWTPRCYSLASGLQPERYPAARTFYLPPLQTAILMPTKADSKIAIGKVSHFSYPFFASWMFKATPDRGLAAERTSLYETNMANSNAGLSPSPLFYRALTEERNQSLKAAFESEKPEDIRKGVSFAFLNLTRVMSPAKALTLIQQSIQRDPTNQALHNLLALTQLDLGNWPAAKVTWLAMMARGVKSAALWNNLGMVAYMEGFENTAIDFFHEATLMEAPREALINLGFIALKYRNGFEAKKHFEKALQFQKDDATAQVGFAIAQLQNREIDLAKEELIDLNKKFKQDPLAKISLGYFLMDIEKENELARQLLSEYMEDNSDQDLTFRKALQETKRSGSDETGSARSNRSPASSDALPTIE